MLQKIKNRLKDQRGLTLIELLAVIVILGIIAAIAVPSIGGLIDNSKKDAHVANAQQMVNSAKLAASTDDRISDTGTYYLTLKFMEDEKYLDTVNSPDNVSYEKGTDAVPVTTLTENSPVSYVKIKDRKVVGVKLVTSERGVQSNSKGPISEAELKRGAVKKTSDLK